MSVLIEKTLRQIRGEHLRPLPMWRSVLSNVAYWIGVVLAILLSSVAVMFSLHAIFEIDWDVFAQTKLSWFEVLITSVPLASLVLLLLFLTGSVVLLHHTRRGYRYTSSALFGLFIAISVLAGYTIESTKWDEPVEQFLLGAIPQTETVREVLIPSAKHQWSQPEKGLLGGTVINVDDQHLSLLDGQGKRWDIEYQEDMVFPQENWGVGDKVKVIGEQQEDGAFSAGEIRIWQKISTPLPVVPDSDREEDDIFEERVNEESSHDEGSSEREEDESPKSRPESGEQSSLIKDVPFTVQAPFAEWSNPLFEDACEEASVTMAAYWISGKPLSREVAKKEILALAEWQRKKFGQAVDTSAQDTLLLLSDYYGVTSGKVVTKVTTADMTGALRAGKLVIVPADGRKLKNPNFKQPGPTHHMVVVVGYDSATKEFITNDPGTRAGERFRYPAERLYQAILDYATGDHVAVTSTDKVMLVITKQA